MKPVIGVPLRYEHLIDGRPILYLGEKVRQALIKANSKVFPMSPPQLLDYIDTKGNEFPGLSKEEKDYIDEMLDNCDGIFMPGGKKFTPYDRYLLECAIKKQIPTLGICLSMQMMSCYKEDIVLEKNESEINHKQEDDNVLTHKVKIKKNSKLFKILDKDEIMVNSFHNFHGTENRIYKVSAISEDGIIEALEYPGNFYNIGLQWHPEISYDFDENSKIIIDNFIEEALKYKLKKEEKQLVTN